MKRRTSWTVSSSWPTPRCDSVSHWSGISTPSAAVSAATVSTPERGRAVEQHPVVVVAESSARSSSDGLDDVLAAGAGEQVGLGAGQLDRGRQQVDAVLGLDDHLGRVEALGQHVVDRELEVLGVDAQREGQAGLRVEVDEQHPVAELGQRRPDARRPWSSWRRRPSGWRSRVSWSSVPHHAGPGCRDRGDTCLLAHVFAALSAGTALVTGPTAGIGHCLRRPARRSAATTWCWSPATRSGWRRSPPSSARRTASRSRCCPPTWPTAAQLATVEARLADPDRPGRPAGQQRRLRPQGAVPRQRRRRRAARCSTCWSPRCCGSATPRWARWPSAATAASSTSRASRRSCRAAPTARRRRG